MGGVDTPGEALDLAVNGPYVYVADSNAGLRVESIANPLQPVEIGSLATSGPAIKVSLNGPNVMLALGDQGLSVVNVANPNVPVKVLNYLPPGSVFSTAGLGPYVLLAEGQQGVQIVNIANSARPIVVSVYDTPGEASFLQVVQGLWRGINIGLSDVHPKVWRTLLSMIGDLVLLVAGFLLWLSFYAQFSLPLHTIQDRINAIKLLVGYYTGERGPALFIENGRLVERAREELRIGRGVAILDTASAAVFRTRHAFTRPAGPGIIFTHAGEYPAGVVDLHPQSISLGPMDREGIKEDPFVGQTESEDETQYQQRQAHRYETSGLTRDGVEIVPIVSVAFKLDSIPGEGKTGFGYDPQAVWNAIAGVGIKPEAELGSDQRIVSWDWLPGHVAVDLWREYLRKYTLDELFVFSTTQNPERNFQRKTAFDIIAQMVRARMTAEEVEELDDTGHVTGKKIHSREYQILKERGIKILSVSIRSLHFPAEVEKQLVDQWFGTWLQRAQEEERQSERTQAEERNNGQELALKEYATASSQLLANALAKDLSIDANRSLELLLQGTLKVMCPRARAQPKVDEPKGKPGGAGRMDQETVNMADNPRLRRRTPSMGQVFRQDVHSLLEKTNQLLEQLVNWVFAFSQDGARRRWNALFVVSVLAWLGLAFGLHPVTLGVDPLLNQLANTLFAANVIQRVLILWLAIFIGARLSAVFLDDVFELKDIAIARRFLQTAAFSGWYEGLTIRDGSVAEADRNSPIFRIGGPGKVDVHLENAAFFEKTNGAAHVVGPTYRRFEILDGFERLRSVIDLRDQYIDLTVDGRSQDGIPVVAKDVRLVYSVYRGPQDAVYPDHFQQPYPFKEEAILNLVYKQDRGPLKQDGSPLIKAMIGSIRSELRAFIGRHRLSEFLTNADTSNEFIPRDQITDLFYDYAKEFSQRAETRGVELKWIGVGTWVIPAHVIPERQLEAWKLSRKAQLNQNEYVLARLSAESRLTELLRLVDEVPNLYYSLFGQKPTPDQITRRLLLDYREKLHNAYDLYQNSEQPLPPELEIVIHHINRLTAIRLGTEN